MSTQHHQTSSPFRLPAASAVLKTMEAICQARRQSEATSDLLEATTCAVVENLPVDRCLFFLKAAGEGDRETVLLLKSAQSTSISRARPISKIIVPQKSPLEEQLLRHRHLYLTTANQAVSVTGAATDSGGNAPEPLVRIDDLRRRCDEDSVIVFPVNVRDKLIGLFCFCLAYPTESISPVLIELGELISKEVAASLRQEDALLSERHTSDEGIEQEIVNSLTAPALVVNKAVGTISAINLACLEHLGLGHENIIGTEISSIISDSKNFRELLEGISRRTPERLIEDLRVLTGDQTSPSSVHLVLLGEQTYNQVLVLFSKKAQVGTARTDQNLLHQLNWERWARLLISKLHANFDRDILLQTAVDYAGRWLKVDRCLVAWRGTSSFLHVTHEYAEPQINPLGLGRTENFPQAILERIEQSTCLLPDVSALRQTDALSEADLQTLRDNGIASIAGTPINLHGTTYGALIVVHSEPRNWSRPDVDSLIITAEQTAVALERCESLEHYKDKLFKMDLLSNLTEQLTSTIEEVRKGAKPSLLEDKSSAESIPLSYRELEVLRLIASGFANREVAQRLFLTESTVELHASRIRKKLNLKTRTALVKYACDHNLV